MGTRSGLLQQNGAAEAGLCKQQKSADNETGGQVKNGCKSHVQWWGRLVRAHLRSEYGPAIQAKLSATCGKAFILYSMRRYAILHSLFSLSFHSTTRIFPNFSWLALSYSFSPVSYSCGPAFRSSFDLLIDVCFYIQLLLFRTHAYTGIWLSCRNLTTTRHSTFQTGSFAALTLQIGSAKRWHVCYRSGVEEEGL